MAFHPAWRGARQYGAVAADLPLPTTDPGDGLPVPLGSKCFVWAYTSGKRATPGAETPEAGGS